MHAAGQPGPTSIPPAETKAGHAGGVLGLQAETGYGASGLVVNCPAGQNIGTAGQAEADGRRADWIRLSADGEDNRQGHENGREDHQDDSQPHEPAGRPV